MHNITKFVTIAQLRRGVAQFGDIKKLNNAKYAKKNSNCKEILFIHVYTYMYSTTCIYYRALNSSDLCRGVESYFLREGRLFVCVYVHDKVIGGLPTGVTDSWTSRVGVVKLTQKTVCE